MGSQDFARGFTKLFFTIFLQSKLSPIELGLLRLQRKVCS